MTLTDRRPWLNARKKNFWLGWPQHLSRFLSTCALLCVASNTVPLLFAQGKVPDTLSPSFSRIVGTCQQFRADIEGRITAGDAANTLDQSNPITSASLPAGVNWTVDSQGRHWAFDPDEQTWRRRP
jgi:hypothetical protein